MAQQGDRYVVDLKEPHLQWGEYRYTDTRETVKDEGYIPIPLNDARRLATNIFRTLISVSIALVFCSVMSNLARRGRCLELLQKQPIWGFRPSCCLQQIMLCFNSKRLNVYRTICPGTVSVERMTLDCLSKTR